MEIKVKKVPFNSNYIAYSDGRIFSKLSNREVGISGDKDGNGKLWSSITGKKYEP